MILFRGIIEGFREIMANRFRSIVTMSGIIMGVASLMIMFALTEGMSVGFQAGLTEYGGLQRVEIVNEPVPVEEEEIKDRSPGITYADVLALRSSAPLVDLVSPELRPPGWQVVTYSNKQIWSPASGVEKEWLSVNPYFVVEEGRFITDFDQVRMNRVVVIGKRTAKTLFKLESPLGKTILIQGQPFTVIGVVDDPNIPGRSNMLLIPIQTCRITLASANVAKDGTDQGPVTKLAHIILRINDLSHFQEAINQAHSILEKTHDNIHDFGFQTQEEWFEETDRVVAATRMSGIFIAALSLVVGGVGITNIMLATIRQRIREIGIRRAVGAQSGDIFVMILIEATLLAIMGGGLGLLAGWGGISLLNALAPPDDLPIIRQWALLISFGSAVLVGTISGLYPAIRAAKLNPVEALKYE